MPPSPADYIMLARYFSSIRLYHACQVLKYQQIASCLSGTLVPADYIIPARYFRSTIRHTTESLDKYYTTVLSYIPKS